MKIILASQSPRRKDLLQQLGYTFEVRLKDIEEIYPDTIQKKKVPEYLAKLKAEAFANDLLPEEVLITSDTIVLIEDDILGKPKDRDEAIKILQRLRNKTHYVISGVCLTSLEKQVCFSEITKVHFGDLLDSEIIYYIDNFKPFDKAGAYAIQEYIGMIGINGIEGCYYNVMGLPLNKLHHELSKFNKL